MPRAVPNRPGVSTPAREFKADYHSCHFVASKSAAVSPYMALALLLLETSSRSGNLRNNKSEFFYNITHRVIKIPSSSQLTYSQTENYVLSAL